MKIIRVIKIRVSGVERWIIESSVVINKYG